MRLSALLILFLALAVPAQADWLEAADIIFDDPLLGFGASTLDAVEIFPAPKHVQHASGIWVEAIDPGGSVNVMTILLKLEKDGWDTGGSSLDHLVTFDKSDTLFETSPGTYDLTGPGTALGTFTGLGQDTSVGAAALQTITGFTISISEFDPGLGTLSKIFFDETKSIAASDSDDLSISVSPDSLTMTVTLASPISSGDDIDIDGDGFTFSAIFSITLSEATGSDWIPDPSGDAHVFELEVSPIIGTVPEPSSFALLALVGLGLLARRRVTSGETSGEGGGGSATTTTPL